MQDTAQTYAVGRLGESEDNVEKRKREHRQDGLQGEIWGAGVHGEASILVCAVCKGKDECCDRSSKVDLRE